MYLLIMTTRKKEALKSGKGELPDLLFTQGGDIMEQNFVRKIHERVLRKAGIRKIGIHDLRHTYASLLLSKGESPVYVKEQLGHHSIQMTVDIYGHPIPSSNRQAVNKLDDLIAPQTHPDYNKDSQVFEKSKGGAEGGTRTRTGLPATPSRWCVYQVPPLRHC